MDPTNLVMAPDRLRGQLQRVKRQGYRFVPLAEFVEYVRRDRTDERICALTFDDGTVDNLLILPGLLSELDAPATVYVCPGMLGVNHPAIAPEAGFRTMNDGELRELASMKGFELGSHTLTHTNLVHADYDQALHEMTTSKSALEDLIGNEVKTFAYPSCGYSPPCPRAAEDAGYSSAVTCGALGSWNPYELARVSPDRLDNGLTFWLKAHRLYHPLRSSPPGRALRRATRNLRHGTLGAES